MTPVIIRRLRLSAAIMVAVATAYCGLTNVSGIAQTPGTVPSSSRQAVGSKPPATTSRVAPAPTVARVAPPGTPTGKDGIKSEESYRDDHTGITKCRNWIYTRSDTVITGTTAIYNDKTDTLDTDDPIVMDDSKHHLTADKAHIEHADKDKNLRLVVLTGHAVMVLKPEEAQAPVEVPPAPVQAPGSSIPGRLKVVKLSTQAPASQPQGPGKISQTPPDAGNVGAPAKDKDREDAKEQQRHGGTATCDKIEYKTSRKFATLTGHVVFKQSFMDKDGKRIERTMTCEHAEYDGKANILHLFKPVHYESNDGQTFDSPDDAFAGTKEGEETLKTGRSTLTFTSPDEEDESDDSKGTNVKGTGTKESKHSTAKGTNTTPP